MIVTGEASGDLHGSNLVKAMRQKCSDLSFAGMGGEELEAAGVEILFDAKKVSVVGVSEVVSHLADIFAAQRILRRFLAEKRPDLLIIIDLPDFNLMLAKAAKKLGIPVFYYICPQVWAWRSGRVKTIAERTDRVGVILPFEEKYLKDRGVEAEYVGHPLLDSVHADLSRAEFLRKHSLTHKEGEDDGCRLIGLLPGSRSKEIAFLLPTFLQAAERLQKNSKQRLIFLLPLASTISEEELNAQGLREYQQKLDLHVIRGDRYNLMAACDAVVAASGTVTLELALLNTPMVVTYRLAPLTYFLGTLLIDIKYFSLVNLIAEREVVPELLQKEVCPENIADQLQGLLEDESKMQDMLNGLAGVRNLMGGPGASVKAADLALKLL
ncbi:lipid-A-disaccharide synthase [Desulfosediminicola ganghwensis]|uniref:lipid-A-disaccharide synthase n=1 Tax=Desulfosediminicola ganghwensis TaxID=2569540 RepID=UPI0010AC862E|nr:lipid-A-disaccharide synthase [Desulfosediminicola ganghwensis]